MREGGIAETRDGDPSARAALVLAALVLALVSHRAPGPAPECSEPHETSASGGWTIAVTCDAPEGIRPQLRGPARILFGHPLDLNRADADALQVLPGIGPGRAAAIVESRRVRPLASLGDLERIRGIGPKTVARLGSWAIVDAGGADER